MQLNFGHVIATGTAHVLEDKRMLPCYAAQAPQGSPAQRDDSWTGSPFPQHLSFPCCKYVALLKVTQSQQPWPPCTSEDEPPGPSFENQSLQEQG